ncbi:hypothetical protein SAMN06269185_2367 [Natronoarchaeum philippinense]|uniref:DUF7130 domain-containing protein n=1 Tax=Natronoarchaeum philippinense TaxID=558529 RepID=A0A285P0T3_NATPI|nr:hypothetical protein [Natronoarchaeum philippinense]SNZ15068.1 hypothetical protein SAMN06269185_2367 [Natronoarchaeum philippinense]
MVDSNERPGDADRNKRPTLGRAVYDEEGERLGTIRGFDEDGFYVTMREGYEALSVEHARSGQSFGEAELMWRCTVCGEMGKLDDTFPEQCPNCDAPKEDIYYWTED